MARPRRHDVGDLLDHALDLWMAGGAEAVTIRALSAASGAPNGAIYHAFGSRDGLVAAVWCREGDVFLDLQRRAVEAAADPVEAIVAAACLPAEIARTAPAAAAVLLGTTGDALRTGRLTEDQRADLAHRKRQLGAIIGHLADRLWGRTDRDALALATLCVVDLPGALLLKRNRVTDPLARHALATAVRAIAEAGPPPSDAR